MRIFIDTNIFIAIKNENDLSHKKAQTLFNKIIDRNYKILVSTQILSETLTVLSQKIQKEVALDFINALTQFEIINLSDETITEALEIFTKSKSKNISFADCTTIALCKNRKYKIDKLFSFDSHFKNMGIPLLK